MRMQRSTNSMARSRSGSSGSGYGEINQTFAPAGKALDYQGSPKAWQEIGTFTIGSGSNRIDVLLHGLNSSSTIRGDAAMIERTVEKDSSYDANGNPQVLDGHSWPRTNRLCLRRAQSSHHATRRCPIQMVGAASTTPRSSAKIFTMDSATPFSRTPITTVGSTKVYLRRDLSTYDKRNHLVAQTLAAGLDPQDSRVAVQWKRDEADAYDGTSASDVDAARSPATVTGTPSWGAACRTMVLRSPAGQNLKRLA